MQCRFLGMILFFLMIFVLLQPGAAAQQVQPSAPANPPLPESQVAPDAAVITIHGLCGYPSLPGSSPDTAGAQPAAGVADASAPLVTPNPSCETVVTRQQFENLVMGINPNGDPRMGRGFASNYPETLIFARKAIETGLDKNPAFQALLQFKYQQALFSVFKAYVKQKANKMSDADIEKFYNANRERYEVFGLARIHVPNVREHHPAPGSTVQPKVDVAADEAAMKALAIRIRAEAAAGGDFEKLQAKAYKLAGLTEEPPDTGLGDKWSRDTLPAEDQEILALKPGQVSKPIHNQNGWNIIKLVSRKTIPSSDRNFTLQLVVGDEANSTRKATKADLNDQYFAPAGSQAAAPQK